MGKPFLYLKALERAYLSGGISVSLHSGDYKRGSI